MLVHDFSEIYEIYVDLLGFTWIYLNLRRLTLVIERKKLCLKGNKLLLKKTLKLSQNFRSALKKKIVYPAIIETLPAQYVLFMTNGVLFFSLKIQLLQHSEKKNPFFNIKKKPIL